MMVPALPLARPTYVRLALLTAGAALVGCAGDGVTGSECASSAECAPGFSCIDGLCTRPQSTSDPLGDGIDAGSPSSRPDAGYARPDASNLDASGTDPDSGSHPMEDAGGICGAAACAARDAECDEIIDDCGFAISCGSCEDGYECGTGPFANRCQCEPRQCEPGQCGRFQDGCGRTAGMQLRRWSDVRRQPMLYAAHMQRRRASSAATSTTVAAKRSDAAAAMLPIPVAAEATQVAVDAHRACARDPTRMHSAPTPDTDCGSPSNGCGGQIPNCGACNVLTSGWSLTTAQPRLIFNNGRMRLSWQADGNLVLYRGTGFSAAWASNTHGRGQRLVFQPDGNFIVRDAGGRAIWSSDTWRQPGERLVLESNCNLVIYDGGGTARWQTRTSC